MNIENKNIYYSFGKFFLSFSLAYFITLQIVFLFEIIPVHLVPFWSTAGIALAGCYLYGYKTAIIVFISELLIYYYFLWASPYNYELKDIIFLSLIFSSVAIIQTLVILSLLKHYLPNNNPLIEDFSIFRFVFLVCMSCLFSSTLSTTILTILGYIPKYDYFITWLIRWLGNSMGMIIFTPILLIFFANPRKLWHQRIKPISILSSIIYLAVISLYLLNHIEIIQNTISLNHNLDNFNLNSSWNLWLTLFSGFILCSFALVTLLILTGRTIKMKLITDVRVMQLNKEQHQLTKKNAVLSKIIIETLEASESKNLFLANMGHELRTPLNAILGFSYIMEDQKNLTLQQRENLQVISENGENLLKLINNIVDLTKNDSVHSCLSITKFNLLSILHEIQELFHEKLLFKNITLEILCDNELPDYLQGDKTKLKQIFANLVDNIIKFTENGKITIKIDYQVLLKNTVKFYFEIDYVSDNFSETNKLPIFQNFKHALDEEVKEGTGLGLKISQRFINLMQGSINFEMQTNKNACFKFNLQLKQDSDVQVKLPVAKVIGVNTEQEYKILIVDDLESNRLLIRAILSPLGFKLQEAESGFESIKIWLDWKPDVVLMDMKMPKMDGYEATQTLRKLANKQPIIIAITAAAFTDKKISILNSGCDDFIAKPFKAEELLYTLKNHLKLEYIYEH